MTLRNVSLVSMMFTLGLAGACGGTTVDAPVQPTSDTDAGTTQPVADSAPPDDPLNTTYPGAHAPIPLVDFNGGKIMTAPKIVTVTFDGDPMRDRLEAFGDIITATPWWDAVSAGYCNKGGTPCIGRGTAGEHVHLPAGATSYTDSSQGKPSSIQQFIADQVAAGTFPAPTVNTLYAIYFADGVSIDLDGSGSCSSFGAYHNTLALTSPAGDGGVDGGGGPQVITPYAIMPRCSPSEAETTISASHEFIEAATDPDIGVNDVAYYMNDQLWAFAGGEVGDVCVDFTGQGADQYQESGFTVQRSWSNKAAKASHDPCVPATPGEAYYNVAPKAGSEQITLNAVGQSKTIMLDAFSDGPMDDWTVSAIDFASFQGGSPSLGFKFDKTLAHNGSHIALTITLKSKPRAGYAQYAIVSKAAGKQTRDWPAVVLTQ
ncbi:MAG: hypothetical protein ABIP39_04755 [Polyangiaceae bacterium]